MWGWNLAVWLSNIHFSRVYHSAVVVDDVVYVFGGRDERGSILQTAEKYNFNENKWYIIVPLLEPVMGAGATVREGLIWLVGGISTVVNSVGHRRRTPILNKVVCFDPILQRWCRKQGLQEPKAFCLALTLRHEIWVLGGLTASPDCKVLPSLSFVAVFHPESDIWEASQISVQYCFAMASTKIHTHVYLSGGTKGSLKDPTKHNYLYNWDNGKVWKEVPLPWPITGAVAQAIPLHYSTFLKGRYFKCMSERRARVAAEKTIQKHYRLKKQSRSDFAMEKGNLRQLKRTDSLKNLEVSSPKWQISSSQKQLKTQAGQYAKHNDRITEEKRDFLSTCQVHILSPSRSTQWRALVLSQKGFGLQPKALS